MPKPKQETSPQPISQAGLAGMIVVRAQAMIGKKAKVLPPFDRSFPDEYTIANASVVDDAVQYELQDVHGWFAAHFLEVV